MVKRVLREAARHAADGLESAAQGRHVAVVLRLKAPLPAVDAAAWRAVKAELRREADVLLQQLLHELRPARARPAPQTLAESGAGALLRSATLSAAQSSDTGTDS